MALSERDFTVPLRCTTFSSVETLTFVSLSPGSLEIAVLTRLVIAASLEESVQPAAPSTNVTTKNVVVRLSRFMCFSLPKDELILPSGGTRP